jgi:hypothetical protein
MTEDEFAALTEQYVAATQARLDFIKGERPTTPAELSTYRDLADREWEIGLAWDAELLASAED